MFKIIARFIRQQTSWQKLKGAENYFSQSKFHILYDFTSKPNEVIDHERINQHRLKCLKTHIMIQWEEMSEKYYDAKSTANIFGAWKSVLETCSFNQQNY